MKKKPKFNVGDVIRLTNEPPSNDYLYNIVCGAHYGDYHVVVFYQSNPHNIYEEFLVVDGACDLYTDSMTEEE